MSEIVTEALLEMHFFKALVNYFSDKYGAKHLKIIKPSPQEEKWVGFDQGWVQTSLTTKQLFEELKVAISEKKASVDKFYLGYFLQFKKVDKITRKSTHIPNGYLTPYYRAELSLVPNKDTKLSQHETLLQLQNIKNAHVSYACAMMFDLDDIYEPPSLDKLRQVPISTAPSGWATNSRHFITLQTMTDPNPKWCSNPVDGKSFSFEEWASGEYDFSPKIMNADQIYELINDCAELLHSKGKNVGDNYSMFDSFDIIKHLPESFTIIEFERINDHS